jgi:hypothetical protein
MSRFFLSSKLTANVLQPVARRRVTAAMTANEWLGVCIGIVVGGLLSWGITHIYYKRSYRDMQSAFSAQLVSMRDVYETQVTKLANFNAESVMAAAAADLWDKRLESAIAEHRLRGTAQRLIESFGDYTQIQKAQLWDAVGKAIRGPSGFRSKPFGEVDG